jgi:hypothetical protein
MMNERHRGQGRELASPELSLTVWCIDRGVERRNMRTGLRAHGIEVVGVRWDRVQQAVRNAIIKAPPDDTESRSVRGPEGPSHQLKVPFEPEIEQLRELLPN